MSTLNCTPARTRHLRLATLLTATWLVACSSGPPPLPPPDTGKVDGWVMRGYLSDARHAIETSRDEVSLPGEFVSLSWTLPTQGSRLPLVIYLPGLDESANAGERWRSAWASAGYAVLGIEGASEDQPPAELVRPIDKAAAASPQELRQLVADQHDALHEWARQRYQPAVAAARVQRLAAVLAALRARPQTQDPVLARLDLDRVALAGYDIGAYTASLAVGELPQGSSGAAPSLGIAIRCVITLSPYADFGGTGFAQRYRGIQVPVLSVSGSADEDLAGVVSSAFVRRAPFENLPGSASLLWLNGASHRLLAGAPPRGERASEDPAGDAAQSRGLAAAGTGRSGGGAGRGGNRGDQGRLNALGGAGLPDQRGGNGARLRSATDEAIDQAVVAATTTAFLDAELKRDALARQWLRQEAAGWIRPRGEWRQR